MRKSKINIRPYIFIIAVTGLLAFNNVALSQTSKEVEIADIETYQNFIDGDWDLLIQKGNKALKQGLDFYYLRYRLGVAYYMNQNYVKALKHFEQADFLLCQRFHA